MEKETVVRWMQLFNDKIQENKQYLSDLDTPIGDGDHGGNMARGMQAVMEAIETQNPATAADTLKIVSMQLLSKVGGASGPLYGSAFMGMLKAVQNNEPIAAVIRSGFDMIQKRGKAELGEKTMLDVWHGVAQALENNELTSECIDELVNASKEIKATKGRASYVGERSIGHIDPGSYSSGLLFKAMLEAGVA